MASANIKAKKANWKKEGIQKQVELDEKKQHNAELELQIQGQMERAHEKNLVWEFASGWEEEGEGEEEDENEMKDSKQVPIKHSEIIALL